MVNTVSTFWKAREQGEDMLTSFVAATSSTQRRAMVEAENSRKTDALSSRQRAETTAAIAAIKRRYSVEQNAARVQYLAQCDQLKQTQNAARAEMRGRWQDYNARRKDNHRRMNAGQIQQQGRGRNVQQGYTQDLSPGKD